MRFTNFGNNNKSNKYKNLTKEELLGNFRSDNWSKIEKTDKLELLQEVENRHAAEQGRTPCQVKEIGTFSRYRNEHGVYYEGSNTIEVNLKDSLKSDNGRVNNNSYEILDTVYHEGEHANQAYCRKNNINMDQKTLDMLNIEDKQHALNKNEQIPYNLQIQEIDSNNHAFENVSQNSDLFKGDPEYQTYLKGREKYYSKMDERMISDIKASQGNTVDALYENGQISQEELDRIKLETINRDQPVLNDALVTKDKIREEQLKQSNEIENNQEEVNKNEIDNEDIDYEYEEEYEEEQTYKR